MNRRRQLLCHVARRMDEEPDLPDWKDKELPRVLPLPPPSTYPNMGLMLREVEDPRDPKASLPFSIAVYQLWRTTAGYGGFRKISRHAKLDDYMQIHTLIAIYSPSRINPYPDVLNDSHLCHRVPDARDPGYVRFFSPVGSCIGASGEHHPLEAPPNFYDNTWVIRIEKLRREMTPTQGQQHLAPLPREDAFDRFLSIQAPASVDDGPTVSRRRLDRAAAELNRLRGARRTIHNSAAYARIPDMEEKYQEDLDDIDNQLNQVESFFGREIVPNAALDALAELQGRRLAPAAPTARRFARVDDDDSSVEMEESDKDGSVRGLDEDDEEFAS